MFDSRRLRAAIKFFGFHLAISVGVAMLAAFFVFGVWYPYPYRELAGGSELFWLVVFVDVICGPILTLVLFNPSKTKKELIFDTSYGTDTPFFFNTCIMLLQRTWLSPYETRYK